MPARLAACFRGAHVGYHVIYGMLLSALFPVFEHNVRQRILKHWSRALLDILHVRLEAHGTYHREAMRGHMLVANHISWLDIIAMNAVAPACFVAKSEVRNWPLLGWLCHRVGTLFIRRDTKRDTLRVNNRIYEMLKRGECVALFPEGTSTDDGLPGHFHSSLLQCAVENPIAICPVAIRYHDGAGRASSDAAYVDDMSFIQSLWKILCSPSLHVALFYLPPLSGAGKTRRFLAAEAQGSIHTTLAKFLPNHTVFVPNPLASLRWKKAIAPL